MSEPLKLRTAIGSYGYFAALKNGSFADPRISFDHVEVEPIRNAFRLQCRNQEFDVSEMAIVTYLVARDYGLPFIALPVFCVRNFWHHAFQCRADSGIGQPKDIEGKRGGVRSYTQTSGVWARGILHDEYGVDLTKVDWVLADEEHVSAFHDAAPENTHYELGCNHANMLASGQIGFAMGLGRGASQNPDIRPLIPDARDAAEDWFRRTGLYPIDHLIVIRQELLEDNPWLANALYGAFVVAKEHWQLEGVNEKDRNTLRGSSIPGDPIPYGVDLNAKTVEKIVQMSREQNVLRREFKLEDLFAPSTLGT